MQRKRKVTATPSKQPVPAKTGKKVKELECPSDYEFGKDTDKFDDCEDCEIWNECMTAKKTKKVK